MFQPNSVEFNLDLAFTKIFPVNKVVKGKLTVRSNVHLKIEKIGYRFILETQGVYKTDDYVLLDKTLSTVPKLDKGKTYSFDIAFQNTKHQTYHGINTKFLFKVQPYVLLPGAEAEEDTFSEPIPIPEYRLRKIEKYLEFVNHRSLYKVKTPETTLKLVTIFKTIFTVLFIAGLLSFCFPYVAYSGLFWKSGFAFFLGTIVLGGGYYFLASILFGKMEVKLKDLKSELFEVTLKNNINSIKHLDIQYKICEEVEKEGITYTDVKRQVYYQAPTQKLRTPPKSIKVLFEYPETIIPTIRFVDTRIYWVLEIKIKTYLGIPFKYKGEFIVSN